MSFEGAQFSGMLTEGKIFLVASPFVEIPPLYGHCTQTRSITKMIHKNWNVMDSSRNRRRREAECVETWSLDSLSVPDRRPAESGNVAR